MPTDPPTTPEPSPTDWTARVEGPGGARDVPIAATDAGGGLWRATITAPHRAYEADGRREVVAVLLALAELLGATGWRLVHLARTVNMDAIHADAGSGPLCRSAPPSCRVAWTWDGVTCTECLTMRPADEAAP